MAFMALFGWIFIPIILLYYILQLFMAPLVWAAEHQTAVSVMAAGLLALNLLILVLLLRVRKRRKQARRAGRTRKGTVVLTLAALWEAWTVFCCAAFLIIQPLRFLPEHAGEMLDTDENWYGTWTVTGVQATAPGCTQTQEETDALTGTSVTYEETQFFSGGERWGLVYMEYKRVFAWKGDFSREYGIELEDLGVGDRLGMWCVTLNPSKKTEEADPLGLKLYMLDEETALLYRRGVFFRAERTETVPIPKESVQPQPPDPNAPAWLGTWTVTDCLGTAPEEPMDPELIEKTVGAELNYWEGSVLFLREDFGGGAGDPEYTESEMTPESFAEAYGVSLEDLGVEADVYLHVEMKVQASEPFFEDLGGRFLLLDGETMVLCCEGAFFRAEKTS